MGVWQRLKLWAERIVAKLAVLYAATRDARTPVVAKVVAASVVAYALSPIDLIPDFIPLLGLIDDIILVPAGIWLALRLIPPTLLDELSATATLGAVGRYRKAGAAIVAAAWVGLLVISAWLLLRSA